MRTKDTAKSRSSRQIGSGRQQWRPLFSTPHSYILRSRRQRFTAHCSLPARPASTAAPQSTPPPRPVPRQTTPPSPTTAPPGPRTAIPHPSHRQPCKTQFAPTAKKLAAAAISARITRRSPLSRPASVRIASTPHPKPQTPAVPAASPSAAPLHPVPENHSGSAPPGSPPGPAPPPRSAPPLQADSSPPPPADTIPSAPHPPANPKRASPAADHPHPAAAPHTATSPRAAPQSTARPQPPASPRQSHSPRQSLLPLPLFPIPCSSIIVSAASGPKHQPLQQRVARQPVRSMYPPCTPPRPPHTAPAASSFHEHPSSTPPIR